MANPIFLPDATEVIPQYYTVGNEIDPIKEIKKNTPTFNYNYLSLNKSEKCFNSDKLKIKDFTSYFSIVKEISSIPILDLLDNKKYHCHYITGENLKKIEPIVIRLLGIKDNRKKIEDLPKIAQIGLYTEEPKFEDGELVSKAPRVLFMLGNHGVLHLLFLDYEHETHAMEIKENKKEVLTSIKKSKKILPKGLMKMLKK